MTMAAVETESDQALLDSYRSGDDVAFEAIYSRYAQMVLTYSAGILMDRDQAEEVLQETFIGFARRASAPLETTNIRSYLFKAARIDAETPWPRLKSKKLQTLVQRLKADAIRFKGMGLPSGERAWAGGVDTGGINVATGQSVSTPGLYFAGEMLDILGVPGGTHHNVAWASAHVAGSSMGLDGS